MKNCVLLFYRGQPATGTHSSSRSNLTEAIVVNTTVGSPAPHSSSTNEVTDTLAVLDSSVSTSTQAAEDDYHTETSNSCNLQVLSRPGSSQQLISSVSLLPQASTSQDDHQVIPDDNDDSAEMAASETGMEATTSYASDFEVNIASTGVVTSTPRMNGQQSPLSNQTKLSNMHDAVGVSSSETALTLSRRLRTPRNKPRPTEKPPPPPTSQPVRSHQLDPDRSCIPNTAGNSVTIPHTLLSADDSIQHENTAAQSSAVKTSSTKSRPSTIRMNLLNAPELYPDETEKHSQCTDKQISTLTASGLFEVLI